VDVDVDVDVARCGEVGTWKFSKNVESSLITINIII